VETWRREYPAFQARCRERFGHAPLHTWFYPPHHGPEHLPQLADMAHQGGGEIELHYHHSDDTAETLTRDLRQTLALYRRTACCSNPAIPRAPPSASCTATGRSTTPATEAIAASTAS
jgi:hypothetical protein